MPVRCAFVDRDGTINIDTGHVFRVGDFQYITGALDALKQLSERDIRIYIVTNQAGIAKGLYTEEDFQSLTEKMLAHMRGHGISIAGVRYCPHHPEATVAAYRRVCECRKPGTALLRDVLAEEGIGPGSAALIGDKNSDIEAGRALGIRTYLVETGYGKQEKDATAADFVVKDLKAAVTHLIHRNVDSGRETPK
jgi:D-glycero-D-manno-heptose 1,7-bisphosphate phosphatase